MAMKSSRVVQNPFNRRQTIPERVKALDQLVPGDMTVFQKGFHWVLQNPNLSGCRRGHHQHGDGQGRHPSRV